MESSVLSECMILWFGENISGMFETTASMCELFLWSISLSMQCSPLFLSMCWHMSLSWGGYLYQEHFQLPPIPLCPCKEPKMSSKQKKPPLDWVGPTLGKGNFAHRDPWKSAFSPNSGSLKLEPLFGQVPVNGLSDELLLGLVKGHFHPSEHICIQSEGKENMFHTNCLLFYCQG